MKKEIEILFENEWYIIDKIPLNNRITIKASLKTNNKVKSLDRDYYDTDENRTIESSKKLAEEIIAEYWRPTTDAEKKRQLKNSKYLKKGRKQEI